MADGNMAIGYTHRNMLHLSTSSVQHFVLPLLFDVRFLQSKPTYKYVSSRKPPKLPPTRQRFKFEIQNIEEDIFHFLPNL